MEKRKIYNLTLLLFLFLYTIINRFILFKQYMKYAIFISASFILRLFFFSVLLLGFKKGRNTKVKKDVTIISIITIIVFFVITYGIGLFSGFLKNAYSLTPYGLLYNLLPMLIYSISLELLRYVIIDGNKNDKKLVNISTL